MEILGNQVGGKELAHSIDCCHQVVKSAAVRIDGQF